MKNGIVIIALFMTACAWNPKDEAWRLALETPRPPGASGNCLPVTQALQEIYGGKIAVLSHPDRPRTTHAVLMLDEDRGLDNGTLKYEFSLAEAKRQGWRFERWWRP